METIKVLTPIGSNIIIKLDRRPDEDVTEGGVIVVGDSIPPPLSGTVVAVGHNYTKDMQKVPIQSLVPGDQVLIGMYSGVEFDYEGVEYRYMKENEIIGKLFDDDETDEKRALKFILDNISDFMVREHKEVFDILKTLINFRKTPYEYLSSQNGTP